MLCDIVEQGIRREVRVRRRGRKDDEWMTLERWRGIMSSLTRRPAASAEMRYARYHTVSIRKYILNLYRSLGENAQKSRKKK